MTCRHCPRDAQRNSAYCPQCAFLTVPEAYKALRVSRATYYRMVAAGQLTPRRVSVGRVLVPREQVDARLGIV